MAASSHDGEDELAADERAARRFRAILALAAGDKSDLDQALPHLLAVDARELEVARVNCWELQLDPPLIRCVWGYVWAEDRFEAGRVVEARECPRYFHALAQNPVILAHDALLDPRTAELADGYLNPLGIRSLMDVPIWVRGSLWGVICHEHVGPARHWTTSERDFAVSMGHIASMALEARGRADAERTTRRSELFMGVVGHDLRTPLSTIRASAELLLLEEGSNAHETRCAAESIARSVERIARMVEQLLDFTQIRLGGGLPIARREVDLRELCERLIPDVSVAAPGGAIELRASGDTRGLWDADRVWQVLSNLLVNAREHGVRGDPVWVALDGDDADTVVLRVGNRGVVPASALPSLFDPFRRFEHEHRHTHGLGLGLFITREIVALHGGTITADSRDGTTVFTVRLPRRCPSLSSGPSGTSSSELGASR